MTPKSKDESALYKSSDQLMVKTLFMLHALALKTVTTPEKGQTVFFFDLEAKVLNGEKEYTVRELIEMVRLGNIDSLKIVLRDVWAADNLWTMNMRHKDAHS